MFFSFSFSHLNTCNQLLSLNLNIWEIIKVVANRSIVAQVHLVVVQLIFCDQSLQECQTFFLSYIVQ